MKYRVQVQIEVINLTAIYFCQHIALQISNNFTREIGKEPKATNFISYIIHIYYVGIINFTMYQIWKICFTQL